MNRRWLRERESEQAGNVLAHLVLPIRPVVPALRTPIVEGVANALRGEHFGEAIRRARVFPLAGAGGNVNVAGGELLEHPRIAEVGQVIDGIVEVKVVVVHSVHEIFQVVDAGHGEAALDDVRMLEEGVGRVIRAERHAHGGDADLRLAIAPNERHDFFAQIRVEYGLHVAAMKGMRGLVVEREAVDGIDAEEFHFAGVDEIAERADHALAFEFPLVAGTRREAEQRRSPVAVDHDAQFDAQAWRMPAMNFALHRYEPRSSTGLSPCCWLRGEEVCQQVGDWSNKFDEELQRWLKQNPVASSGTAIAGCAPTTALVATRHHSPPDRGAM